MGMDGANSVDAGTGLGDWHQLALEWSEGDGRGYAINGSGELGWRERSSWCRCQVLCAVGDGLRFAVGSWRLAVGGWRSFALVVLLAAGDRLMVGGTYSCS